MQTERIFELIAIYILIYYCEFHAKKFRQVCSELLDMFFCEKKLRG